MHPSRATGPFRYESFEIDPGASTLTCNYALGDFRFTEQYTFEDGEGANWANPAVAEAARIVFLLAGVSYYKTGAPDEIDLGDTATTAAEREFLRLFFRRGLGEFAYRNQLDLSGLTVSGPEREGTPAGAAAPTDGGPGRPLVPFGGGIDSIVTADAVRAAHPGAELFVMSRAGDRFAAIERPAALTGLPVRRVGRSVDPQVLRSAELGFLNGHVPVTGILSAVAVLTAALWGHDAVVMSNEWSASVGNVVVDGVPVNHQWSKSLEFESAFRSLLAGARGAMPGYFSFLRPCSELWVARRFAALPQYLPAFMSCNRAFILDSSKRADRWCGRCDKCCFIDLILSPFVPAAALSEVFGGKEPLENPACADQFRTLLGLTADAKPFECVGDVDECRAAAALAAGLEDRQSTALLAELAHEAQAASGGADLESVARTLLRPMGEHHLPDAYASFDQLV